MVSYHVSTNRKFPRSWKVLWVALIWRLVHWLMLAVSWKFSWGYQLEFLCVASLCGLGFLTTWRLGSNSKCRERKTREEPGGSHIAFHLTGSLPQQPVCQGIYKDLSEFKGREHKLPPLNKRIAASYCKTMWNGIYIAVAIFSFLKSATERLCALHIFY